MTSKITTIGFDADDTLWANERFFQLTQNRFAELLSDFAEKEHLEDRLLEAERRNLGHYGFGVKGFVLSMIETAIEVTGETVPASVISELMDAGREMLAHPIELLPHAAEAVAYAAQSHTVLLVTKGDLLDQERKLAQSGLGDLFDGVEIVSDKTTAVYHRIFSQHGECVSRGLMVGNSMKSDVLPMVHAGGWGVYVPHGQVWALEAAEPPTHAPRYHALESLHQFPQLIQSLTEN